MTTSGWQIQTQLLGWWKPDDYNAIPKTTHPIPPVPALYWLLDKWPAAPHTPLFSSIHLTHTATSRGGWARPAPLDVPFLCFSFV